MLDEKEELQYLKDDLSRNPDMSAENKCELYEKIYLKSERLRSIVKKRYQQKYRIWRKTINRLEKCGENCIKKIFNEDQSKIIKGQHKRCPKWCDEFLVKAFKLKFSCGSSGYKNL